MQFIPRWLGGMASLLGCLWFGTLGAAEGSDQKIDRLGFAFDQHAHDVAVAAVLEKQNTGSLEQADDIIHLPKYIVSEKRVPFVARDILTPEGRVTLAEKRYISPVYRKTFGPLSAIAGLLMNPLGGWQPNGPEAMALYEDDERMRRGNETKALMRLDALHEDMTSMPASVKQTK